MIVLLQISYTGLNVVDATTESQVTNGKVPIVCTVEGDFAQTSVKMIEEDNVPSYTTPERAVNATNALIKYRKALEDKKKERSGHTEAKPTTYVICL